MSKPSLKSSLIRIWSKESSDSSPIIVGAGFVVTPEYAVTCAHVINSALDRDEDDQRSPGPDERISLDFLGSDVPRAEAEVLHWFPVHDNPESNELEDIAVLKLIDPLPAGVYPVSFAKAGEQVNRVRMCGFPGDARHGTYLTGMVQGAIKNGWIELHPEDNRSADPGFSGTAAWDMEQHTVCGMIVSRQVRTGNIHNVYMIPAEKLIKVLPDMNKHVFSKGHALIIGVPSYSPYAENLPCTLDDAKGLADIFEDEGRCAYPSKQVSLLTDEEADRTGILAALDRLAAGTQQDSTVVIYFSGHGGTKDGVYYFCPHGYNPAALAETTVSGKEFTEKIAAIPAKKKLILLDCCHAGGIGVVKGDALTKAPVPPEAIELFQQGKGCVFIASSAEDEVSYPGKPYSVFTGALIEALCGKGVAKKDGYVRAADLAMYTRERVPRLIEDKLYPQHPVLHFEEADNFVLAYYAGGEDKTKDLPFDDLQANVSEQCKMADQQDALLNAVGGTEIMQDIVQELEGIRCHFIAARHLEAYQSLSDLCHNNKKCNGFSEAADYILNLHNELEDDIIFGRLPLAEHKIQREKIKLSYRILIRKMISFFEDNK